MARHFINRWLDVAMPVTAAVNPWWYEELRDAAHERHEEWCKRYPAGSLEREFAERDHHESVDAYYDGCGRLSDDMGVSHSTLQRGRKWNE